MASASAEQVIASHHHQQQLQQQRLQTISPEQLELMNLEEALDGLANNEEDDVLNSWSHLRSLISDYAVESEMSLQFLESLRDALRSDISIDEIAAAELEEEEILQEELPFPFVGAEDWDAYTSRRARLQQQQEQDDSHTGGDYGFEDNGRDGANWEQRYTIQSPFNENPLHGYEDDFENDDDEGEGDSVLDIVNHSIRYHRRFQGESPETVYQGYGEQEYENEYGIHGNSINMYYGDEEHDYDEGGMEVGEGEVDEFGFDNDDDHDGYDEEVDLSFDQVDNMSNSNNSINTDSILTRHLLNSTDDIDDEHGNLVLSILMRPLIDANGDSSDLRTAIGWDTDTGGQELFSLGFDSNGSPSVQNHESAALHNKSSSNKKIEKSVCCSGEEIMGR